MWHHQNNMLNVCREKYSEQIMQLDYFSYHTPHEIQYYGKECVGNFHLCRERSSFIISR